MNLPYFVLGPVFPGCSRMWAATLQRPWQLTSNGQRKLQSAWCQTRWHFLSTSFQRTSFEKELELVLHSWSLRKMHSDGSCWSVGYLAHTLYIHTGQSHLSVVGVVEESWTS